MSGYDTVEEYEEAIARGEAEPYEETRFYTETGAGSQIIKHNGKDVTVDLQGIARYDHYNTLGTITINLDDTRYYDQSFKDEDGKKTEEHTYSEIKPGQAFEVGMYTPDASKGEASKPNQKTADEMKTSDKAGEASGEISEQFIDGENAKIAKQLGIPVDKLKPNQKWYINYDKNDITKFTVTAPKNAKAGDFISVPVTYTYTNGSTDVHWFHFVVQESDYNKPEYFAKVGYQGDSLVSTPDLPETDSDLRKVQPKSYSLVDGATYTDDKGNVWTDVEVDPKTGVVTATVPTNDNIQGGEELYVPVVVHYENDKGEKHTETVQA